MLPWRGKFIWLQTKEISFILYFHLFYMSKNSLLFLDSFVLYPTLLDMDPDCLFFLSCWTGLTRRTVLQFLIQFLPYLNPHYHFYCWQHPSNPVFMFQISSKVTWRASSWRDSWVGEAVLVGRIELMCLSAFWGMHSLLYPELSSFQSKKMKN